MASKFVISPKPFIEKCRSLVRAKNLYVDVEDGQVRLAWTTYSEMHRPTRSNTLTELKHLGLTSIMICFLILF